ncbi:MAG: CAP domain-containing protein, partial [Bradyrhizobium sp.]|nr:CAP domain-containing protein [Bradyrhizobium sp.]
AGDYDSDRPKPAPKSRGKAVVAQTAPRAEKSETKPVTRWGAKPPASKDCHLNIKVIGLCI